MEDEHTKRLNAISWQKIGNGKTNGNAKKELKNSKGITLVALAVTIIVLLILAGITINMLFGENGIINQAQEAKEKTKQADVQEQVDLIVVEWQMGNEDLEGFLDTKIEETATNTSGKVESYAENEDGSYTVTIDGIEGTISAEIVANGTYGVGSSTGGSDSGATQKKYDIDTTITVDGKSVLIPAGFTVSGCTGISGGTTTQNFLDETTIDGGLVIYRITDDTDKIDWTSATDVLRAQKTYDQFVWIPVDNPVAVDSDDDGDIDDDDIAAMIAKGQYPMAITTGTTTDSDGNTVTNYKGVLYDFASAETDSNELATGVTITVKSHSASLVFREPAYLTESSYADASTRNNVNPVISTSLMQTEFNTMVESVKENGGFWVGRYETSNMTNSTAQDTETNVTVIKGTTTGISETEGVANGTGIDWYRMYAQQKNYAVTKMNTETITSSMIWGSQWDQILIWMKDIKNESQNSYYVINSVGMGNFGTISGVDDGASSESSPANTGYSDIAKVKNIYDLAGNLYEWTMEAGSYNLRVARRRLLLRYK